MLTWIDTEPAALENAEKAVRRVDLDLSAHVLACMVIHGCGDGAALPAPCCGSLGADHLARYAEEGSPSCKPLIVWLRGQDLNLRPSGYEPDELPDCSTPRLDDDYNGFTGCGSMPAMSCGVWRFQFTSRPPRPAVLPRSSSFSFWAMAAPT